MSDECTILVICDDDLTSLELRQAIGEQVRVPHGPSESFPTTLKLRFEEAILSGTWEINIRDHRFDLCICALSSTSPEPFMANNPAMRDRFRSILFITDSSGEWPASLKLRKSVDKILVRPYTDNQLRSRIEQLLFASRQVKPSAVPDEAYLAFLRKTIDADRRTIAPSYDSDSASAYFYPQIAESFGFLVDDVEVLEHLTTLGICRRHVSNRMRACPTCDGHRLSYREVCPRCHSLDFSRETILHHFACSHMDSATAFKKGDDLVCPKCRKQLRHIGLDYDKPAAHFKCNGCHFIAPETLVQAQCMHCHQVCAPDETSERIVHSYDLMALADEAVAANNLSGFDMASVLRNRTTGLYAKQFFHYELKREVARFKRYATPSSLLMVRLNNLAHIRVRHPDRCAFYLEGIAEAITGQLRTLDLTCVWASEMLGVLLPATPAEGAKAVAVRMQQRVADFQFDSDSGRPDISVSMSTCEKGFENEDDYLKAALEGLEDETNFEDKFVILE